MLKWVARFLTSGLTLTLTGTLTQVTLYSLVSSPRPAEMPHPSRPGKARVKTSPTPIPDFFQYLDHARAYDKISVLARAGGKALLVVVVV